MYGIRQHGGTMPHDACKELEQKQQEVHYAPHNRYAVNAFSLATSSLSIDCTSMTFSKLLQI